MLKSSAHMKKKVLAYFSGVFATVLVLTMVTTALAASGKATFNFVNVSLRGEQKIAAGADITVANSFSSYGHPISQLLFLPKLICE